MSELSYLATHAELPSSCLAEQLLLREFWAAYTAPGVLLLSTLAELRVSHGDEHARRGWCGLPTRMT